MKNQEYFAIAYTVEQSTHRVLPTDCEEALLRRRLPRACQVNMLQLKCQRRYPEELTDLSPLEERLIGLYQPCGWITKFH